MKVVILAAGKGTRLGQGAGPKPLTLLENGKSILQLQIESLAARFPIKDIIIVVGYKKEMITTLFPKASFVYSANYAEENTAKSLLKAVDEINDDVLWLNGDVVFHPDALDKILCSKISAMLVNRAAVNTEEVKYRTDDSGNIVEVSKAVVNGEGEALGINLIKQGDLQTFRECLTVCDSKDYFEKAIESAIQKGVVFEAVVVDDDACVEVDFPEDVDRANTLLKQWR